MENLLKNQKSVIISSLNKNMEPAISYAPFIMKDNKIYIYISKVADHYYNLLENEKCSVMVIEDEKDSKTIFARGRVSFSCKAKRLDEECEDILEEFGKIHGDQIMMVLKTLDFDVFELTINSGRLVKGFGKAFDVQICDGKFVINEVSETGHLSK